MGRPRQQLYICKPCKRQEFRDVEGKAPAVACTQCGTVMVTCAPSQAQRHFRQYELEQATA